MFDFYLLFDVQCFGILFKGKFMCSFCKCFLWQFIEFDLGLEWDDMFECLQCIGLGIIDVFVVVQVLCQCGVEFVELSCLYFDDCGVFMCNVMGIVVFELVYCDVQCKGWCVVV